jgi:hypothetical protein
MVNRFLPVVAVGVLGVLAEDLTRISAYQPGGLSQARRDTLVLAANSRMVFETLSSLLVERNQLQPEKASQLSVEAFAALERNQPARLTTLSVAAAAGGLAALVPEQVQKYITSAGGRYFMSIDVEPVANGRTVVRVRPTIVATVRGSGSPLGGRLLPSNGRLEGQLLDSLQARVRRKGL